MKKIILLCLLWLTLLPLAQAEMRGGILGGLNFAKVRSVYSNEWAVEDTFSTDYATHLMGGVYGEFALTENFFLEAQLRYMEKGGKINEIIIDPWSIDLTIRFIELPLYAKYKFLSGSSVRPFFFGGPAFGVRVGETITIKNTRTGESSSSRTNTTGSDLSRYDLAAEGGLGVEFMLSDTISLAAVGAYSYGLLDLDKSSSSGYLKTRGLQAYAQLGMAF